MHWVTRQPREGGTSANLKPLLGQRLRSPSVGSGRAGWSYIGESERVCLYLCAKSNKPHVKFSFESPSSCNLHITYFHMILYIHESRSKTEISQRVGTGLLDSITTGSKRAGNVTTGSLWPADIMTGPEILQQVAGGWPIS